MVQISDKIEKPCKKSARTAKESNNKTSEAH